MSHLFYMVILQLHVKSWKLESLKISVKSQMNSLKRPDRAYVDNTRIWLDLDICSLASPTMKCSDSEYPIYCSYFMIKQFNSYKNIYPGNRFFTNERKGLFYSQSLGWIFTIHLFIPFLILPYTVKYIVFSTIEVNDLLAKHAVEVVNEW